MKSVNKKKLFTENEAGNKGTNMQAQIVEMELGGRNEKGIYPIEFTFEKDATKCKFRGYVALVDIDKEAEVAVTTLEDRGGNTERDAKEEGDSRESS